ncbi:MAG: SPOR domain-containing protein [Bacteroidales bacterium]
MIINKYIKLLLDEKKRVILPGFGNLEIKEAMGEVPISGEHIQPPGLKVKFGGGFSKDDGLLASAMADGEKLEEEEARQRVLELVDSIKFSLDKGEPYQLDDLGSLSRDSDGKVHFRIDRDWVLEPEQFGLEPLDLLELDESEEIESVPSPPVTIGENETFTVEQERPVPPPRQKVAATTAYGPVAGSRQKEQHPRKWRAIWLVAAVLIVVLVVLILIPSNRDKIMGGRTTPPAVNTEPGPSATQSPSSTEASESGVQDFESLTPEALEQEPAENVTEPSQPAEKDKYFLIAGSFSHLRNASELQDKLKANGIAAEVMITENRMYRVSVGSFVNLKDAESELLMLKSRPGLESCWILSN